MQIRHNAYRREAREQPVHTELAREVKRTPTLHFFGQLFCVERSTLVTILFSMSLFLASERNDLFLQRSHGVG